MADMPKNVMLEIRRLSFEFLDEKDYLSANRKRSGELMDVLVGDANIGSKIAEYCGKERVRTYIKDSILNRYTKDRTKAPEDWTPIINELYDAECVEVGNHTDLRLFRDGSGTIFVASHGRLIKWETGLRKLLEYQVVYKNALLKHATSVELCLILTGGGGRQTSADFDLVRASLDNINIKLKIL